MPGVARVGDACSGHGCWPPRGIASGSPNVTVNGIACARTGDDHASHTCPAIPETHSGSCGTGSSTVTVNGMPIYRAGDPVTCGGSQVGCSSDTTAGG